MKMIIFPIKNKENKEMIQILNKLNDKKINKNRLMEIIITKKIPASIHQKKKIMIQKRIIQNFNK